MLSETQKQQFWNDGVLVVENAKTTFADWVEQSREHTAPFGETIDGRPRFDVEPGHTAEKPGLRRVNAPVEISQVYFEHSNDDLVTALLMVDDVTEENGPLEVIPGSHKGDIHDLWHDGVFTGSVADDIAADCQSRAVTCTGSAGSVCLMHTRLLHGSAPNRSDQSRTLFICVYSAEDAVSYSSNPVPNKYEGLVVSGEQTNRVRSVPFDISLRACRASKINGIRPIGPRCAA